jgi:hypothetical protein
MTVFRVALGVLAFMCGGAAWGTTYYVSSSSGSDANNGTSANTAWQTVAKVNAQALLAGDSVLFRRGDVWNESLVPGASGAAGNPITFDAYGAGTAPNLTGYYAVPASAWVLVSGNAWKAPVPGTFTTINFCLFGSVWGQKVAASTANLTDQWDFYFANGYVYVYSASGDPASYYGGPIVPMGLTNTPVININGKSWLTFQHLLINWFDEYGVYVQGVSDHLVFANMEADSMIPQGTQPLGFYVNESAPGPGDIKIYNSEAHLNYDGFRFDGAATAITMVNDKAYANRDGALVDNIGAVTYSYCHFYASSLAVANSTDVLPSPGGPTAGPGNIPPDTPPAVQAFRRYPAQVTLSVDDAGMTAGTETYYANTVLLVGDAAGVPVGAAITVGYPLAQTLIPTFQGWINAGRDVTSHSISHTYYTNTDALEIQYTGSGTAATLNISNNTLTITVTGAADSVSYNLAQGAAQGTIGGLELALNATGHFTVSENPACQGPYGTGCSFYTKAALLSQDLADVTSADVRSGVYHLQLDVTRLTTDEITLSRQWMTSHLTGLPAAPVYVYPGGYETPTMQGIAAGVPYAGARGALKEDLGVKDTYASGFDVQNITSFGVNSSWMGLPPATLNQKVQALVWKQMVWGVPWGIFWHWNASTGSGELSATEITNLIQDLKSAGATIQTNTGLVNWLLTGAQEMGTDGNFYYKFPAASVFAPGGGLDFRPAAGSPVVGAGQNLGAAYAVDINGVNQNSYGSGWEIGAHAYMGYSMYGQTNPPAGPPVTVGEEPLNSGTYSAYTGTDPVQWPSVIPDIGGLTNNHSQVTDSSLAIGGATPATLIRCTDSTSTPGYPDSGYSAGLGGSGDGIMFDTSSSVLHVNLTSGNSSLVLMNPATGVCASTIFTRDLDDDNPGLSSQPYFFGGGAFSLTTPGLWVNHGSTTSASVETAVNAFTINTSTGHFRHTQIAYLLYGMPVNLTSPITPTTVANAPAWTAGHSYNFGDYISATLTSANYPLYQSNAASGVYALGDIVVPTVAQGNTDGCAFKLVRVGTTDSTPPNWNQNNSGGVCSPPSNHLTTDGVGSGAAQWRNLGTTPTLAFVLQNTGGACTSGSTPPTWLNGVATSAMPGGHPDFLSVIADSTCQWTHVGVNVVPQYASFGGAGLNEALISVAYSTNNYGPGNESYANTNGGQGSAVFALQYDAAVNRFHLWNTVTGIFTDYVCSTGVGGGYSCIGGSFTPQTLGQTSNVCRAYIHNLKAPYGNYVVIAKQAPNPPGAVCTNGNFVWRAPQTPFNADTQVKEQGYQPNHWSVLKDHIFAQVSAGYAVSSGVYGLMERLDSVGSNTPPANWVAQPCTANGASYYPSPDCYEPAVVDSHLGGGQSAGFTDSGVLLGSMYNVATLNPIEFNAWQGEEIGVSTGPTTSSPGSAAVGTVYRFTHDFNLGSNPIFDSKFHISQASQDGGYIAFTSDWNGQLGSTTGIVPTVANGQLAVNPPAGVTYNCLGGPTWKASTAYQLGLLMDPIPSTNGGSGNYDVFQVITAGTTGATHPDWTSASGTPPTIADGTVIWQDLGVIGNCRSDVIIAKLPLTSATRNVLTLAGSQASAVNVLLTVPNWTAGNIYYGVAGAKQHGDWSQSSCGDSSGVFYAYQNTGSDIGSASVAPTACALNGTTLDGGGTWKNSGVASFSVNSCAVDSSNNTTIGTAATINGTSASVAVNDSVFTWGFSGGCSFLNGVALAVTTVSAHSFVATGAAHAALSTTSDAATLWDTSNYSHWVNDEYFLRLIRNFSGAKIEMQWTGNDTGTTGPSIDFTAQDATFNTYFNDVNYAGKKMAFSVSHMDSGASGASSSVNDDTPRYVADQLYANTACRANTWQSNTSYVYHQCVYDGSHYQYLTSTGAASSGTSGATIPSWNHSSGTTSDNGITWTDMGTANAPLQEFFTCANYQGNANMTALGNGVWTLATAQGINSSITDADLVTAYPWIGGTPYQTGMLNFDDQVLSHYGVAPWGPNKFYMIHMGDSFNGQSLPTCAATIQGSGFANTGTGTNFVNLWTGAVKQNYLHRANTALSLGLPNWFVLMSPQSSSSQSNTTDTTDLSDIEANCASQSSASPVCSYTSSYREATGYAGATSTDAATYAAGGHLNADAGVNLANACTFLGANCYVELLGAGNCANTGNGRLDLAMNFYNTFNVKNFGVYSNDFWRTDPNQVEYTVCGQAYMAAIQAFEGGATH